MTTANPMRFEIVPSEGGKYRVHFRDARNGKIILWSQPYADIRQAAYAVALTKLYARTAPWNKRRKAA